MMKSLVIIAVLSLSLPVWVSGQTHTTALVGASVEHVEHATCAGSKTGAADILLSTHAAPHTISWASPLDGNIQTLENVPSGIYSLENLPAGDYDLQITDAAGNESKVYFVITEPAPLTLETVVLKDATCNGLSNGAATVKVQGGAGGYSYHWMHKPYHTSASVSGLSSGMYVVIVKDRNGCEAAEAVTIINERSVEVEMEVHADPVIAALTIRANVTEGAGNYTYKWNTGDHTAVVSARYTGLYEVEVTDTDGCQGKEVQELTGASEALSVSELQAINDAIRVGPVPSNNVVNISVPGIEHHVKVAVMSMNGQQLLLQEVAPSSSVSIELGHFPKGSYSLHVISGNMRYPLRQKVLRQ